MIFNYFSHSYLLQSFFLVLKYLDQILLVLDYGSYRVNEINRNFRSFKDIVVFNLIATQRSVRKAFALFASCCGLAVSGCRNAEVSLSLSVCHSF
jgi:hypothetical protein